MGSKNTPSPATIEHLAYIVATQYGDKVRDGITYTLVPDGCREKVVDDYETAIEMLKNDGVEPSAYISKNVLKNGTIYEMNFKAVTTITAKLATAMTKGKTEGDLGITQDAISRIDDDIKALATYILKCAKAGKSSAEIALYSRNKENKITITARDKKNEGIVLTYDAFALRLSDLEKVNSLTVKQGVKITKCSLAEVLASYTGVRCIIYIGRA